jgi:hypothetical protein
MAEKKLSCELVASANRKRWIFLLDRYCIANSSSIRCNRSRFWPMIGTLTKQYSGDQ